MATLDPGVDGGYLHREKRERLFRFREQHMLRYEQG